MSSRHERGLLDTSVWIDLDTIPEEELPLSSAVASVTLAELAAGVHTTSDPAERGARLARLQGLEASLEGLPFDASAARAYGHFIGLVMAAGQNPRPRRLDLMIAATAHVHGLPVYTRNPSDFRALGGVLTIVAL